MDREFHATDVAVVEPSDDTMSNDEMLDVLEPDQLVSVKSATRFGPRHISRGLRFLLWGLRLYVIAMLIIIIAQIIRTVH